VGILPENADACKVFNVIQNQLIMGFNGPVDINQLAVHEAMRIFRIKGKEQCFEKVLRLGNWWMARLNKKD